MTACFHWRCLELQVCRHAWTGSTRHCNFQSYYKDLCAQFCVGLCGLQWRPFTSHTCPDFWIVNKSTADPSSRAAKGVGLRPSACWDRGFESHRGHGCLLWVFVLSGRGLCDGPIPRPEESHRLWCVWVWSSENKQPLHLLWTGRRGKDCEKTEALTSSHSQQTAHQQLHSCFTGVVFCVVTRCVTK
jgi:hypothetical protein